MLPILDNRLISASQLVRENAVFADIGSDHAYLPIYLALKNKISFALASDINEGPINAANENIKNYNVEDKVVAVLSDGLTAAEEYKPSDIAILGMGGELIISIIEKAPWVKNSSIRLILQPMTHAELLYSYLCENGFDIISEKISSTSDKRTDRIYRIICAEYSGNIRTPDIIEEMVGRVNKNQMDIDTKRYIQHVIDVYSVRLNGKKNSTLNKNNTEYEEKLILGLKELL